MTTLTQVAITTRKIIRWGIYGIVALIILRILFTIAVAIRNTYFPKPPPAPTVAFGKLPAIGFPTQATIPQITYTIETAEGALPVLSPQAKVYFMSKLLQTQLNLPTAREKASGMGFSASQEKVSDTLYRFYRPEVPSRLEMNIVTGAFSVSYDLASDQSPLDKRPPTPEVAASYLRSFLSSGDVLPLDLTGPINHEFVKIENQNLVGAISLSEADLVKVNLTRKDYDELPTLTPNPTQSNVWFMVSGASDRKKQVVAGEFRYYPVDEKQFATYPIKDAQTAFEELKGGKGYIASMGQNETTVVIREVYLAYYDPDVASKFFQPIIVFEGDRGFVAYVPAVTSEYYGD